MILLTRAWLSRPTVEVAKALLGQCLWFREANQRFCIVETEAYTEDDPACHAYAQQVKRKLGKASTRKPTGRSAMLFNRPGLAYVYFTYGMHHCLNVVTEPEGVGGAVLIRALAPVEEENNSLFPLPTLKDPAWSLHGPARLTKALGITTEVHNGLDLLDENSSIQLCEGETIPEEHIVTTTRIGITKAVDYPWRFYIANHPYVSVKATL